MTRTELDELALKLANNMQCFCTQEYMGGTHEWFEFNKAELSHFSYALLVEIQKRLEVVGYIDPMYGIVVRACRPELSVKLTTLPIIEE